MIVVEAVAEWLAEPTTPNAVWLLVLAFGFTRPSTWSALVMEAARSRLGASGE